MAPQTILHLPYQIVYGDAFLYLIQNDHRIRGIHKFHHPVLSAETGKYKGHIHRTLHAMFQICTQPIDRQVYIQDIFIVFIDKFPDLRCLPGLSRSRQIQHIIALMYPPVFKLFLYLS